MKLIYFVIGVLFFVYMLTREQVEGQTDNTGDEEEEDDTALDPTQSYCFRFTWLGPEFDNTTSNFTTTCEEYMDAKNAEGIPCRQPFVVSYDGTPPDINYLWENHRKQVVCRQARGHVCAKYSYAFNGELMNVTHMCTRVFDMVDGAITAGCYTQKVNGYDVELCICKSNTGGYMPCNSASIRALSAVLPLIIIFVYFLKYR